MCQQWHEGQGYACHTDPGGKRTPPTDCVNLLRASCARSNKRNCCAGWVTRDQWHSGHASGVDRMFYTGCDQAPTVLDEPEPCSK